MDKQAPEWWRRFGEHGDEVAQGMIERNALYALYAALTVAAFYTTGGLLKRATHWACERFIGGQR